MNQRLHCPTRLATSFLLSLFETFDSSWGDSQESSERVLPLSRF